MIYGYSHPIEEIHLDQQQEQVHCFDTPTSCKKRGENVIGKTLWYPMTADTVSTAD